MLSMLQCVNASDFINSSSGCEEQCSFHYYLDKRHWQTQKVQFISEVLMEHRNRPVLNPTTNNWYLPTPTYDEQRVLAHVLDFCRMLCKNAIDTHHILQNALSAILFGRKEFSGLNLSGLNLKNCRFFNITCSRKGKSQMLAADFSNSIITEDNFVPENHQNQVMEYVYHGNQCFTIDDAGIIKCWDILSGKMEYELHSGDPLGITDFSTKGYIKISRDGHWLAAKVQETQSDGDVAYINLFDLTKPESGPKAIRPTIRHNLLTYFAFTNDSKSLLMLCDRKTVYCADIATQNILYGCTFDLYKQSELYAESAESCIFAYTAEYNTYEADPAILSTWINDDSYSEETDEWTYNDDDDEDDSLEIPCALCSLMPKEGEMQFLYHYTGTPGTEPTVTFMPDRKCFIFFNYITNCIEQYDCKTNRCRKILENLADSREIPPSSIQVNPLHTNELYIIYPDICFNAEISDTGMGNILMTYTISGVEKLRSNSDESGELEFKPYVIPTMNRFVVADDTNTYEWDVENDQLILKYNSAHYACSALFSDPVRGVYILVHEHNGLSIFGGEPLRLINQYCFQEPGYLINNSLFDAQHNLIALPFVKPEHEKVVLLDLTTGEQRGIYSTIYKGETIENLCFSDDGNTLLITSQYRCTEYDLIRDASICVVDSGNNERFIAGNYVHSEIEIAVVEHSCVSEPRVKPYCCYYKKGLYNNEYRFDKVWSYEMPVLEKTDFQYFLHGHNDLGALGSIDESGCQQYWVTKGFFLEENEITKKLLTPKCFKWHGNRKIAVNREFYPYDMIFVCHSSALENQYSCGRNGCSYIFLSEDMHPLLFRLKDILPKCLTPIILFLCSEHIITLSIFERHQRQLLKI